MKPTDHNTKAPHTATGIFVAVRGLVDARGTGAPKIRKAGPGLNRSLLIALVCALVASSLLASMAVAAALGLPDNRAYEMVTPLDKNGLDALGHPETVRTASSGDAISFFATGALPGSLGATSPDPTYIAVRGPSGWTTHGQLPPDYSGSAQLGELAGVFPDQSKVFVDSPLPLAPGGNAGEYGVYAQEVATGDYQYLFSDPTREFKLLATTPDDSHFIFQDETQLLPQATAGHRNLYESSNGQISLVGILPAADGGDAPAGGSTIPAGYWPETYVQTTHVLSNDGSTVFFRNPETENLYVREHADSASANTTQVDESVGGAGEFQTASADGSRAFFTKAGDLYMYDLESGSTTDLAPGGEVDGVLGTSEDGSYVYFAAKGVLAAGAVPGQHNLYEAHNDGTGWTTSLVTTISEEVEGGDPPNASNWDAEAEDEVFDQRSRVTPDGKTLLFSSDQSLTGYDNQEQEELYLYEAATGHVTCVSCDPSGEPAEAGAELEDREADNRLDTTPDTTTVLVPANNLSSDGSRVFFDTAQALLPQDTNGVADVYEWERTGSGSCASASGCLYLISTGYGLSPSYFAGASADGSDVFFFTSQQLVAQDQDELQDIYDARIGGGVTQIAAPACTGTGCQGVPAAPPIFSTPSSATFNGVGNFSPSTPQAKTTKKKTVKCAKGKKLSHGKCVKVKSRPKKKSRTSTKGRK